MRVLFTGSSSFTGLWLVRALAERGHQVVATFRGRPELYDPLRAARTRQLEALCRVEFDCPFGSRRFVELAADGIDVLCHHAAEMRDYRSPDYDFVGAVGSVTENLRDVLRALAAGGGRRVVSTGTVFEHDEGAGEQPLRAFSPYGLAKGLTWQVVRHFAAEQGLRTGKFVIPNPFGPWESPRFTTFLANSWFAGDKPVVRTPAYLRDNVHVSLLALAYADFVERLGDRPGVERLGPCGYVETQGAFAERVARAMRPRLGLPCELELAEQTEFDEPLIRTNTDVVDGAALGWDEQRAWDQLAEYYRAEVRTGS